MGYESIMLIGETRKVFENEKLIKLARKNVAGIPEGCYHLFPEKDKKEINDNAVFYYHDVAGEEKEQTLGALKKEYIRHDIFSAMNFSVIARVDLCKAGNEAVGDIISDSHKGEMPVYYFGDDGNTIIAEDRYEANMYPVMPEDVLKALREEIEKGNPYRRFLVAEAALAATLKGWEKCAEDLRVIFFGY